MASITTRIPTNVAIIGHLSAKTMSIPAGTVDDADVKADARIAATKLEHQHVVDRQLFEAATTVIDKTELLGTVYGAAATLVSFKAFPAVAPVGGDLKYTVDLRRSTVGGAFATVLTAPIEISVAEASADRVPVEGVIDTAALVAGDALQVVVDASGSTGTQGTGLAITLVRREDAA